MTESVHRASALEARRRDLRAMTDGELDLLVLGTGATGCAIARDAALRGLRVAAVDKADIASGTSSRSSKLIHGGLRYLQQGDLKLVFEGVSERELLMRLAPHLVRPLEFLTPQYRGDKPSLFVVNVGLWIYDAMEGFAGYRMHKTYWSGAKVRAIEPCLRLDGLQGGIVYYDGVTDDARLVLETALDARALGARVVTYAQAERLLRDANGAVVGVSLRDRLSGESLDVRARAVVCALGPFTDQTLAALGAGSPAPLLRPSKGVHLVFPDDRLHVRHAIVVRHPRDGRVVFLIPWEDQHRTIVGTTDTDYQGDLDRPLADAADAEYLLHCTDHFSPDSRLRVEDAISSWAGLRPLIDPGGGRQPDIADDSLGRSYDVSREHHVFEPAPGLVAIAGGKLTTYRRMARDAVDHALRLLGTDAASLPCRTQLRPLPGAQIDGDDIMGALAATQARLARVLPADVACHLAHTYGVRAQAVVDAGGEVATRRLVPELPYIWAEVDRAVRDELAMSLIDVLRRRIPLALTDRQQGLGVCEEVATRLAGPLGWSEAQRAAEVDAYRAEVASSLQFREAFAKGRSAAESH